MGQERSLFGTLRSEKHPSRLSFCLPDSSLLLRQEAEAHRTALLPLVLVGSLNPAWEIIEDQVLFCQRLACLAEGLATQSCALLIFQLLISARSEISLAMTHGSSWPQRQVCGQYSLFLALFLALTGHPSWESPLPMSQPLALAPFILCC